MATATGGWSGDGHLTLRAECYEIQADANTNRSLMRLDLWVDVSGSGYWLAASGTDFSAHIAGQWEYWSRGYTQYNSGSTHVGTIDKWVGHDDNGAGSASFQANSNATYGGSAATGTGYAGMSDFNRAPGQPGFSAITRTTNSFRVQVSSVSSPASGLYYQTQINRNGEGWGDTRGGQDNTYSNLTLGANYQFRTWAGNNDGTSGITTTGNYYVPNVPQVPTITVGPVSGRATTITCIQPASDATITEYYVQASADNGVTWGTEYPMGLDRSYDYTQLTGGAWYKFRTRAINEMGTSAWSTSASTFIPSGGKRWNGTAWVPSSILKRWNGTAWVDVTIAKRWNGTAWVDLS